MYSFIYLICGNHYPVQLSPSVVSQPSVASYTAAQSWATKQLYLMRTPPSGHLFPSCILVLSCKIFIYLICLNHSQVWLLPSLAIAQCGTTAQYGYLHYSTAQGRAIK